PICCFVPKQIIMKAPLFLAAALLSCWAGHSQTNKPLVSSPVMAATKPIAMNIKALKGSQLFVSRQQLYANKFTNPSKRITYSDGTALNISLIKSPSFADQSTSISAISSPGAPANGNSGFNCATSNITIKATSTTFLNADYSAQASHIY